jgi:dihydroxyacetone synthase
MMLHFSGYERWTIDEIRNYHAPTMKGIAAGHPEIEFPGVEVTTGPLGQGIANAVGLAMAGKNLGATYNREKFPIFDGKVYCFTGDGCIQEGIGQEGEHSRFTSLIIPAISIAGHFGLDNLILIYDNNAITVDGNIDECFTDDTSAKLKATGWEVIEVYDGSNDVSVAKKESSRVLTLPACCHRDSARQSQTDERQANTRQHPHHHWAWLVQTELGAGTWSCPWSGGC